MMKNIITFFLLLLFPLVSFCEDVFSYDGIVYTISADETSCSVKGLQDNYEPSEINIPADINYNGKNYSVTQIGGSAFANCSSLIKVIMGDNIIKINGAAFWNCSNLEEIKISSSLKSLGFSAFSDCPKLLSIQIPEKVDTLSSDSFTGCTGLKNIIIDKSDKSLTVSRSYDIFSNKILIFKDCPIESLSLGRSLSFRDNDLPFAGKKTLKYLDIKGYMNSVGNGMFKNCTGLESVTIPSNISLLEYEAFSGCTSLSEIIIEDSESILYYEYGVLSNCPISKVYLGRNLNYPFEINNNGAFANQPYLREVVIGDMVTEVPALCFSRTPINSIKFGKNLKTICAYAFGYCTSISDVILPEGLQKIEYAAFKECRNLKELTIPNSVYIIETDAFKDCQNLKSLTLSSQITEVPYGMCQNCVNLEEIVIPDKVEIIGTLAFQECQKLSKVTFGKNLKKLDDSFGCFGYCNLIKEIISYSLLPPDIGRNFSSISKQITAYVYADAIEAYKANYNWNQFKNILPLDTVEISKIVLNQEELTLISGDTYQLYATYEPQYATNTEIIWKSSNPYVATVSQDGLISAKEVGNTEISATAGEATAVCKIEVKPFVQVHNIEIEGYSGRPLNVGDTLQLEAKVSPANATINGFHWTSSNSKIISVDETGLVNVLKEGEVTISVCLVDNPEITTSIIVKAIDFRSGEFTVDGLVYKILNDHEVEIKNCRLKDEVIIIPEKVDGPYGDFIIVGFGANLFLSNSSVRYVEFPVTLKYIDDGCFYYCTNLTTIGNLPNLENIGNETFYGCTGLTTLGELPSLITIGTGAFEDCTGLTTLGALPSLETIGDRAFERCTGLTTLGELPSLETVGNRAFKNCTGISTLGELPSLVSIGNNAFETCTGLTSLGHLPSLLTIGNSSFEGCNKLTTLGELPLLNIIGEYAFNNCTGLTTLGNLPSLSIIKYRAFNKCSKLKSMGELPALTLIGESAFYDCSKLESLEYFPNLIEIEGYAFLSCDNIKTIKLGERVSKIGELAFHGSMDIKEVYSYNLTPPEAEDDVFSPFAFPPFNSPKLIVPTEAVEAYRTTEPWKKFMNIEGSLAGINEVIDNGKIIDIEIKSGTIYVNGLNSGQELNIYDMQGNLKYRGYDSTVENLPKGIYIIKVGNFNKKIIL